LAQAACREACREFDKRLKVDAGLDPVGGGIEKGVKVGPLTRLHKPKVARGLRERTVPPDRAKDRQPKRRKCAGEDRFVPFRSGGVENHARDLRRGVKARKAAHQRRNRACQPRGIDDKHDRQAENARKVGGRAFAIRRRPVE
jgi:hypothetical protein